MGKYVQTPTEKKLAECERLYKKEHTCECCGKHKDDCAMGYCEACRRFYLDECCDNCGQEAIQECSKEFNIDLPDDAEGAVFDD
jgi:hypothetical protein